MLQVERTGQAVKLIEHQQGGEKEKERERKRVSIMAWRAATTTGNNNNNLPLN